MYLLDTDHLTFLQRGTGREFDNLADHVKNIAESEVFVSVISFHEQMLGWHNYVAKDFDPTRLVRGYERFEQLVVAFAGYQIRSFDMAAADVYTELRRSRVRVGAMDLKIASVAIASGFTLLTRNAIDFERVPNLTFEDWTRG